MAELLTIKLPDVGDFDEIEIIEVLIAVGDEIAVEESIIVLESDKATMEIPSPYAGKVESILVKVGDRIAEGTDVAKLLASTTSEVVTDDKSDTPDTESKSAPEPMAESSSEEPKPSVPTAPPPVSENIQQPQPGNLTDNTGNKSGQQIHANP